MPTSEDRARGSRVGMVRGRMDQRDFVERLNAVARTVGLPAIYDVVKLSKMENGARKVTLDDAIVVAALDSEKRGVEWLAGITKPRRQYGGKPYRRRGGEDGKEESA